MKDNIKILNKNYDLLLYIIPILNKFPKRVNHLYSKISNFENLLLASKKSRKGKRYIKRTNKKYKVYKSDKLDFNSFKQSIQSWIGHVKHANSYKLRVLILDKYTL